ncbi:MAG: exonuclease domain-containing protein [Bacteroidota bacterium]
MKGKKDRLYAIVDLETTGGRASRDKITEIAIVLHDGQQILDQFESLVNPECPIPYGITELTGISQEMVTDAPKFYEIAKKVVEMTEGAVFVAHNVRFDYSFLQAEFRRLGFTFSRKNLCTVRLSRKAFPGLPSYSLGKLIRHFDIQVPARHRAMADTLATVELFQRILAQQESEDHVYSLVNLGMRESLLPKNLSIEKIHALPEENGVYYFHNVSGDVVYVGKSKNIRKRVAQHFSKKTSKASKLQQSVHDISFELTGNELVALLLESHEIKRLAPPINRAQRQVQFPYSIHTYVDQNGYQCFESIKVNKKLRKEYMIVGDYSKSHHAANKLKYLVEEYTLCSKLSGIERGSGPCFNFHLKKCKGACIQAETPESYNDRVMEAMDRFNALLEGDFMLIGQGRSFQERSVVWVEGGSYRGFGFVEVDHAQWHYDALQDAVKRYQDNPETRRMIRKHVQDGDYLKIINPT